MSAVSIIKDFDAKGLKYTATSLTSRRSGNGPDNVFTTGTSQYFYSSDSPSDQWWQIEFEKPVSIKSYVIQSQASLTSFRPKKWLINISNDGNIWKTIQETGRDSLEDLEPFNFTSAVTCKFFRIVLKENTGGDNRLVFSYFDCFGEIAKAKTNKLRSCMNQNRKYRMTYNFIILVGALQMNS